MEIAWRLQLLFCFGKELLLKACLGKAFPFSCQDVNEILVVISLPINSGILVYHSIVFCYILYHGTPYPLKPTETINQS